MTSPGSPIALFETFEAHARATPGRILISMVDGSLAMNAAALLARARSTERLLAREGVSRGDLVLLSGLAFLPFTVAQLAVWARGAASVSADAQLSAPEVEEIQRAFQPRAMMSPGPGLEPRVATDPSGDLRRGSHSSAGIDLMSSVSLPEGTAVIKVTSGSTGSPRGIAATAGQLLADARHIAAGMHITSDDVCIAAISLSHSYGMANVLLQLVVQGSPMLIVPAPLPEPLAEALGLDEPAVFAGVPYLFEMMARPGSPPVNRRGLKCCISAAAPLRPAVAAAFRQKTGLPVRAFYGTSETGGITFDNSAEGDAASRFEGCVGSPLPGARVTLEPEEGTEEGCDEGRVVVSGEAVSAGYVGAVSGSATAQGEFRGGAFRTGDTGQFDQRGMLHLTGRISTLVNVSGRKVNPAEIERCLARLPMVGDAAVLGVSDGVRGESLVVFVSGSAGLTRERVVAHLKNGLAAYKIPRRVIFMKELPRNLRGKLDHETLRRLAADAGTEDSTRGSMEGFKDA